MTKKIVVKLLPGKRVECFPPKGIEIEVRDYGYLVENALGIPEPLLGQPIDETHLNHRKKIFPHIPRDIG